MTFQTELEIEKWNFNFAKHKYKPSLKIQAWSQFEQAKKGLSLSAYILAATFDWHKRGTLQNDPSWNFSGQVIWPKKWILGQG